VKLRSGRRRQRSLAPLALLVTDRPLVPPWSGNRVRILGLIHVLRAAGWRVVLLINDRAAAEELRTLVDGIVVVHGRSYQGGDPSVGFDVRPFRQAVTDVARTLSPSVVIAEYAWLAPALSGVPGGVERWVDCHDVLHERTSRFQAAGLDPWVICMPEQEAALLASADLLLASQEREAVVFQGFTSVRRVVTLLPPISFPNGFRPAAGEGHTVLAVGARHAGNSTILEFARDVWPSVSARMPEARLRVVGEIAETFSALPGVDAVGGVDNIGREYGRAAAVVCPIAVGSGVKIKVLEALRFGKATVVTPVAVEGLPQSSPEPWICAESLPECADAVLGLLLDRPRRAELEQRALAYGERYLSLEASVERLRPLLTAAAESPA
jgi:Glycosyl transferases group 1